MNCERAEQLLTLQLDWVRSADAKVPPIFAIDLAMLGVITALINTISNWTICQAIFSAFCLIFLCVSIIFLALGMFPRLSGPKDSYVFFEGIVKKSQERFIAEFRNLSDEVYMEDLLLQIYRNSEIAEIKFKFVKYAFISLFIGSPFWIATIFSIYMYK